MTGPDSKTAHFNLGNVIEANDRRSEPRFSATGEVRLVISGPQAISIPARILDVSKNGMRVQHMYAALTSGMLLQIDSGNTQFTARVVWNRIRNDGVESGFFLL